MSDWLRNFWSGGDSPPEASFVERLVDWAIANPDKVVATTITAGAAVGGLILFIKNLLAKPEKKDAIVETSAPHLVATIRYLDKEKEKHIVEKVILRKELQRERAKNRGLMDEIEAHREENQRLRGRSAG